MLTSYNEQRANNPNLKKTEETSLQPLNGQNETQNQNMLIKRETGKIELKLKEIRENFAQGLYDNLIFSNSPQLSPDLKMMISKYNRDFIQRFFFKCISEAQIDFWVESGRMELPTDSLALAIALGNNIFVLKYLKSKGWFEQLSPEDKVGLIQRASRFDNAGLAYLKKEFSEISSPQYSRFIK